MKANMSITMIDSIGRMGAASFEIPHLQFLPLNAGYTLPKIFAGAPCNIQIVWDNGTCYLWTPVNSPELGRLA